MTETERARFPNSGFRVLPPVRCEQLLARTTIGRVAFDSGDGPTILPVNYAWYGGRVVFRTSLQGVLAELVRRQRVAFEIDDLDEEGGYAWSVLVRGAAEAIRSTAQLADLWANEVVVPWASGSRTVHVGITPERLTGRAVRAR